jgi:hypothetical protein
MDAAFTRFDQFAGRDDSRPLGALTRSRRRRGTAARARRIATLLMVLGGLVVATIAFGLFVGPIGIRGLFLVALLMMVVLLAATFWPSPKAAAAKPVQPFRDDMSNRAVVQRLGALLSANRSALPPVAAQRAQTIAAQLPLLESRLAEINPLDPLAQDARRLMGQHLPELIERYERVPRQYRGERDGDGKTIDERLVASLDAAHGAIDDFSRQLSEADVAGFQTQGRFIEARYRDDQPEV